MTPLNRIVALPSGDWNRVRRLLVSCKACKVTDRKAEDDEEEPAGGADTRYIFDPDDVPVAAAIVDAAFTGLDFGYGTVLRIQEAAKVQGVADTPLEMELIHAAGHDLHREVGGKPGCELGRPQFDPILRWPRPIAQTPDDVVRLLHEVAAAATAQAAIARFEDLLFTKRAGNGLKRVRRATAAYLAAVEASDEIGMDVVDTLLRVWSLGRSVGEPEIDEEIRRRMSGIALDVMTTTPGAYPGVSLPMLSALAIGPVLDGDDPHDVDGMLARAAATYTSALATQIAADRRSRAGGDQAKLDQIARDEVAAYFTDADAANEPAVRMIRLTNAARVASQRGLPELARRAASLMQQIKPSELGLKRIRVETSIPSYVPESFIAPFTRGATWRDGLAYFFAGDPPSGPVEQIREIGKSSRGTPASLFPATVFGAGGLPRVSTQSEEDEDAHYMNRAASISAQHFGLWLAEGLTRMSDVYEIPTVEELTSAIVAEGCRDPQLARGLAKGFRYFWDGDFEASVAVALPKFEAAARALLRELDEGIYKVQLSKDPGGYVGLYLLLDELEKLALDPSWAYFFRWLLVGPYGANLRNDVAHGFVFDPGPVFAALTLRAVSVLALVAGPMPDDRFGTETRHEATESRPRREVLTALTHPTGRASVLERAMVVAADRLERATWWIRTRRTETAMSRRRRDRSP